MGGGGWLSGWRGVVEWVEGGRLSGWRGGG